MPFPREIHSVSIVGSGLMGRSIAALHLAHGVPVTIADVSREVALDAAAKILDDVHRHGNGSRKPLPRAVAAGLLQVAESDQQIAEAHLVIEALPENLRLKRRVLSRLAPLLSEQTIVATNTSSLVVEEIASSLPSSKNVCGLHFCHPVDARPLVEVVRTNETSDDTLSRIEKLMHRIGKQPLVVADRPGFLVNRLLWPYLNEGLELLHDGVEAADIEAAACHFGFPWGPLTQLDAIGIDTALRVGAALRKAYPDRVGESQLLVELYEARRFGQKCGEGILCDPDRSTSTNSLPPVVREIVSRHTRSPLSITEQQIRWRLTLPILLQAARILDEQMAGAEEIDAAIVDGLRFFAEQGGVLRWADAVGLRPIIARLRELVRFGDRFSLPISLTRMAANGRGFYPAVATEIRRAA